ncbi:MAG: phosphoribosylaminoimidazolesuccinocarboxamide synthase [Clostridia bacterium]|nr:phosphoribosylaminoimidazolesuccinocarboxamide synthase [Clostridia bacterium]
MYEGKAKVVYATEDPEVLIVHFKDEATAFNAAKRGVIADKGAVNRDISAAVFRFLEDRGVPTHFLGVLGEREMRVRRLRMLPLEVVVRNVAAGSLAQRLGLEEGRSLPRPVVELYLKDDRLGDPLVNDDHALALGWADAGQLAEIRRLALSVNEALTSFFAGRGIRLVDFKLEFGVDAEGRLRLGDEVSPDTCRLWDAATGERLDKDRFRRELGGVAEAYREVRRRLDAEKAGE